MSLDTVSAISGIADGVAPEELVNDYHPAVGAILNQHGWNLAWGGVVTLIGALFIWRGSMVAVFVTALVGGMLDFGYFLFLDLGGYVRFVPGTIMTLISGSAIALSLVVYGFAKSE
ncbi:MAG: hypothetical protein AAGA88_11020 [Pseudomonadota bacterium]